jgi:DNA-binding Xre family transcriptional regulator
MQENKLMLILVSAAPYVSWGESRAKLLRRLLREKLNKDISSYQVHRLLVEADIDDISIAYVKKLLGDSGKNHIAATVALDKVLQLCDVLQIKPSQLIPIFEIDAPVSFVDPINLDTTTI